MPHFKHLYPSLADLEYALRSHRPVSQEVERPQIQVVLEYNVLPLSCLACGGRRKFLECECNGKRHLDLPVEDENGAVLCQQRHCSVH